MILLKISLWPASSCYLSPKSHFVTKFLKIRRSLGDSSEMLGFVLGDCGALAIGKRPLSVPAINWASSAPYTVRKPGTGPQRVSCCLGNDYRVLSLSLVATALLAVYSGKTLSVSPCISGAGPGCDAAAEGSPLIRSLQEKSRANKVWIIDPLL